MDAPPRARTPQAVLFACGLNSVRSPMAESLLRQMFPQALYVKSAGVRKGELDPFAVAVMAELGQDISEPQADDVRGARGLGRAQFRSHHHAVAGSPSQGAGTDAHPGGRCRILADAGSDRHRRQPRAEACRLSRSLRRPYRCASAAGLPRRAPRAGSLRRPACAATAGRAQIRRSRERRNPYAAAGRFEAVPSSCHFPRQRPVVMGPCVRRDDGDIGASTITCSPVVEWSAFR